MKARKCESPLNLANLSKEKRDDIQLEIRASRLIRAVKLGKKTRLDIQKEIDEEFNQETKEKLKFYLNKYRKIKQCYQ